ncbi:MAG: thioredoxin domain-containing protein, partial [Janthinobacterium lividum]
RFFLAFVARLGKTAGWPLTVFLAPNGVPFDGGGYYPPEPRFGLPSFSQVLNTVERAYRGQPAHLATDKSTPAPKDRTRPEIEISDSLLDHVCRGLAEGVDPLYGGFGTDGPKFLHAAGHELLLRAWRRTGRSFYLEAAAGSLAQILDGAVFDHVGGGFHRYAVDDRWHVPHFEKMLNDNAMMIRLCTQLWQATRHSLFSVRVRSTIEWLIREMRLPDGSFASSLAADNVDGEGAFYLWTRTELAAALGVDHGEFLQMYGAASDGRASEPFPLARENGGNLVDVDPAYDVWLERLLAVRDRRDQPTRNDWCLADWNGLAITALAEAALTFDRPDWLAVAQTAFAAVLATLGSGSRLFHCTPVGEARVTGLLDDYAAMAQAALALHEVSGRLEFLDRAVEWEQVLEAEYWDDAEGGYFLTARDGEQRVPRQKYIDETSSPAGNALMLGVLARLLAATGNSHYRRRTDGILRRFADVMSKAHLRAATALCHSQASDRLAQIVIVGRGVEADVMRHEVGLNYLPDRLLLTVADDTALPAGHPGQGKTSVTGLATTYACIGPLCLPPASSRQALRQLLAIRL